MAERTFASLEGLEQAMREETIAKALREQVGSVVEVLFVFMRACAHV